MCDSLLHGCIIIYWTSSPTLGIWGSWECMAYWYCAVVLRVRKKTWEGTCIHILTTNPGIVRKTKNSFFFLLVYFVLLHFLVTLNIFSYVMSHSYLFCYESLVCIYLAHFSDREIIFLLICGHSLCIRDINLCPGKRVSWLLP